MTGQNAPHPPLAASSPGPSKVLLWMLAGAFLGVVLTAVISAPIMLAAGGTPSARETAEQYFAHIAAGEASAAVELQAPTPPESRGQPDPLLLTDAVLGSAVERINDVEVRDGYVGSTYADFEVRYTLGGEHYSAGVTLEREEGAWLSPDRWMVTVPATNTIIVTSSSPAYRVSGVELPTVAGESYIPLPLFPAVYPIEAAESTFFQTDTDTLVSPTLLDGSQTVALEPNEHFTQELDRQITLLLDACTTQNTWRPEGCPLSAGLNARDVPVVWTIEKYPEAEIDADAGYFFAEGGEATATYAPEGASAPVVERVPLGLSGPYSIDGDSLSISYP
ncbi:hypothetical protein [Microbacterium binotii]|uniref:hypothetical protein n=1 Tax=Microbacterium binotii TaxID=462710 RepID=UPI001F22A442|nr:hypothetical protein [Microbacterium binotii]UIN30441.1 hypothetical protein LXM64_15050 [Microbacterium binotii]